MLLLLSYYSLFLQDINSFAINVCDVSRADFIQSTLFPAQANSSMSGTCAARAGQPGALAVKLKMIQCIRGSQAGQAAFSHRSTLVFLVVFFEPRAEKVFGLTK